MKSLPSKRHLCFHQDDSQLCTLVKSHASKSLYFANVVFLLLYTPLKSQPSKRIIKAETRCAPLCTLVKSLPSKRMQAINLHILKLYTLVKSQTFKRMSSASAYFSQLYTLVRSQTFKRSIYKRYKGLLPIENLQKDILLSFIPTSTSMLWTILLSTNKFKYSP